LLGGVRIEINGKVIDGTLRAKLGGLKNLLEG
ncbi:F0F1 ATP synthase subunit delta, partial [Candidatus Bipolaricaulota bacterium]|nr:F0F1 ATP synthase subunit delta [Candidatus Bipolaricaulota bacterium]